ncbi:MAG TPA: BON domain-containing protein [Usitatibacter sp.]|jgi:osmotically-inducible protein OsmY|nr:BON domain-containing protein [Usitatibacter sp.]
MKLHARLFIPALLTIAAAAVPAVPLAQDRSSSVIVEGQRVLSDAAIQERVASRLMANTRLEGRIGVESHDAVVTLSGWTRTEGQAWIAAMEARNVAGVAYVHNMIRPRMGA